MMHCHPAARVCLPEGRNLVCALGKHALRDSDAHQLHLRINGQHRKGVSADGANGMADTPLGAMAREGGQGVRTTSFALARLQQSNRASSSAPRSSQGAISCRAAAEWGSPASQVAARWHDPVPAPAPTTLLASTEASAWRWTTPCRLCPRVTGRATRVCAHTAGTKTTRRLPLPVHRAA